MRFGLGWNELNHFPGWYYTNDEQHDLLYLGIGAIAIVAVAEGLLAMRRRNVKK